MPSTRTPARPPARPLGAVWPSSPRSPLPPTTASHDEVGAAGAAPGDLCALLEVHRHGYQHVPRSAPTVMAGGLATAAVRPSGTTATPAAPLVGYLLIIEGPQQFSGGEVVVTRRADVTLAVAFVDEDGSPLLPPA